MNANLRPHFLPGVAPSSSPIQSRPSRLHRRSFALAAFLVTATAAIAQNPNPIDPNHRPDFPDHRPPHGLAPCICGPLVGNHEPDQIHVWHVQSDGGPVALRLNTVTVNTTDPQATLVDVFDGTNHVGSVAVGYTSAEAAANGIGWEKSATLSLGAWPAGKVLRVQSRVGGTPQTQFTSIPSRC